MKRTVYLLLAGLAIATSGAARAEVTPYHVSVTPFIGYRTGGEFKDENTDNKVELGDASSFGLILNGPASDTTEWEVLYSHQSAGIQSSTVALDPGLDIDITYYQLGGTYVFEGPHFRPFIAAGIGASHFSPDQSQYNSDTYFAFSIGGGAHVFPTSRVGLRLEGRFFGSVIDSDSAIFCVSNGGATCSIHASGDILWQFEAFAGLTARF